MDSELYFDAAATTMMSQDVIKAMNYWCNRGNPSSAHKYAEEFHTMRTSFEEMIATHAKIKTSDYYFIWTSGASESNCTIIQSVVKSYKLHKNIIPHIIVSAVEHKSIMSLVECLVECHEIELTVIPVDSNGTIIISELKSSLKPNTALVCIQSANNETGACNDLITISDICHQYIHGDTGARVHTQIPIHVDAVQSYGKKGVNGNLIDSFSISFHKFGGPPGVGCLVVSKEFYDGYDIKPLIHGSQNSGHRGGTENVPGIGASYAATKINFASRDEKNTHLSNMRNYLIKQLNRFKAFPLMSYEKYLQDKPSNALVIVASKVCMSHIMLISFVDQQKRICGVRLRKWLASHNVYVSVGSACNTKSEKASHVLDAISADEFIRAGTLRISFDDSVTSKKIDKLINAIVEGLKNTIEK
jgi:cysteine desulfurase